MRDLCFDSKAWESSSDHLSEQVACENKIQNATTIIKHNPTEEVPALIVNSKKEILHQEWLQDPYPPPQDAFSYFKQFTDYLNANKHEPATSKAKLQCETTF